MVATALPALAQDTDSDVRGEALVLEFIEILKQPDTDKRSGLADFLADEFQIVRSNGAHMDKTEYVANPATVFEVGISDVHATEADGVLVVSYVLSVDEILDGVENRTVAPRLSVFHMGEDSEWRIAAHANFGALDTAGEGEG
jgi:hypothetical protein